jgi:SAM-dependent methyltransferase
VTADVTPDTEVTSAEIARLANVGRAAVSNWRRRYPEFPKPVGGSSASPTFSWSAVEAWLSSTGKADQLRTEGKTDTGTQRLDAARRFGDPARRALNAPALRLHAQTRSQADAQHRWFVDPQGSVVSPAPALAKAMAALLPRTTVGLVLDPACGTGELLRAVGERFGVNVEVAGQDISAGAAEAAKALLEAATPDVPYVIHTEDSLTENQLRAYLGAAAAVVCEPPLDQPQWPAAELANDLRWTFGLPAPRDSELAWVQHCYAHLRPNGTAVIAVTPRACVEASGRQIRASLVRSGVLQAVIALPRGVGESAADIYLWVLRRPYGDPDHTVRMVDLGDAEPANVPTEFAAWQAVFDDSEMCRQVQGIELLDDDVALLPSRFVTRVGNEVADLYARAADQIPGLLERISTALPRFASGGRVGQRQAMAMPMVNIGELERAGSLRIRPRGTTPRPGDILMRWGNRPPMVATEHETGDDERSVTHVIEIESDRLDSWFVAAFLQADTNAIPATNTLGALSREDLRRCRIPRLPPSEQRRYGDAFRKLDALEAVLRQATEVSACVIRTAAYGLTSGALVPPD